MELQDYKIYPNPESDKDNIVGHVTFRFIKVSPCKCNAKCSIFPAVKDRDCLFQLQCPTCKCYYNAELIEGPTFDIEDKNF